jgi:hypothetical protein
MGLDFINFL